MSKIWWLILLAGCFLCPPALAQLPSGGPWVLRFADEFNDTYAANQMGLDSDKWNAGYPWGRTHNYPAYIRDENIRVNTSNNGMLQLWGKRESFSGQPFTSGAINTNGHYNTGLVGQSGYMEARMKMPNFNGAWPAFWSLQDGWPPEIDMMEFVKNTSGANTSPNNFVANVHFTTPGGNASAWSGFKNANVGDLTAGFHNFGLRWTNNTLTWYVDGNQFHSYTGADAIAQMDRMYLILNLGIGGWPGDPPAGENVNKSFDVDWVRVWKTADAAQSNYIGPAGGNQNWEDSAKWSSGVPRLASTVAFFGNPAGSAAETRLDWVDAKVSRGLTFRTSANYKIGWEDDLLMLSVYDSGSSVTEAVIDVQVDSGAATQGTHTIASRVELHSDARVKNATANVLTFSSDFHGDGRLTLDSGETSHNGTLRHRGGTYVVGSADATFNKSFATPDDVIHVGTNAGSNSTLRLSATATTVAAGHIRLGDAGGTGTLNQSGGAVTINTGEVWVGQGVGSTGNYNHSGGSLTLSNWLAVGRSSANGTYRLSGNATLNKLGDGNLIIGSLGGVGSFIQTGGTVNVQSGNTLLGEDAGASGAYTISGGTATLRDIILSQRGPGSGVFNLDGGTVTATRIGRAGTGAATFNFNGGVLRPSVTSTTFMQGLTAANVQAGGAVIDTNGFDITIAQPLLGPGRLTKNGLGNLSLSGANNYTGGTTINAGMLSVNAALAGGITVAAAGRLGGTGTIAGAIDVSGKLAPGNSAGNLSAASAQLRTGSTLSVEIAGPVSYDVLALSGALTIDSGSTLAVTFLGGFVPVGRQSFDVISYDSTTGQFSSYTGLQLDNDLTLAPFYLEHTLRMVATIPGDANGDFAVTFADFQRLERAFGRPGGWEQGDFDLSGVVDHLDFAILHEHFNQSLPLSASFVPEPGILSLLALAMSLISLRPTRGQ